MSPPITSVHSFLERHEADYENNKNFKFSGTFDFAANSSDAAVFGCSKMATGLTSGRMKPRLTKLRRKRGGFSREDLKPAGTCNGIGSDRLNSDVELKDGFCCSSSQSGSNETKMKAESLNFVFDFSNNGLTKNGSTNKANFEIRSNEVNRDFRKFKAGESPSVFVFGNDFCESTSNVKRDSIKCSRQTPFGGDGKSKNINFVFGANENGSRKSDVSHGFDLENFVSKNNIKNGSSSHNVSKSSVDDRDKGNTGFGTEVQGIFTFKSMNNGCFNIDKSKQLNGETKTEDCNGVLVEDNLVTGSTDRSNFRNCSDSGCSFQRGPVFNLCEEMKGLNFNILRTDSCQEKNNNSSGQDNVRGFEKIQINNSSAGENCPINPSEETPEMSNLLHKDTSLNDTFSLISARKEESHVMRFTGEPVGLDSSDKDFRKSNLNFSFSAGGMKVKNRESTKSKRILNMKLRKAALVENSQKDSKDVSFQTDVDHANSKEVSSQTNIDHANSKEVSSQTNIDHAGCGSPMDISPCRNKSFKCQSESVNAEVDGLECAWNKNHVVKHDEKSHVDDGCLNHTNSSAAQDGLSVIRKQYRKKFKSRVGSNCKIQGNNFDKENSKQDHEGAAASEICENWRIRGNQAYQVGKFSTAEEFYSQGIESISSASYLGFSEKPLILCYSNRAAARMNLGRMREAIGDCTEAAKLDPNFWKVRLRAGNCYLILGEVEHAINSYTKCLEPGSGVRLDKRIVIEASDGIQKAKRVSSFMLVASKLLQEGTPDAVTVAIGNITDAMSISHYSDRLIEMKGEALFALRRYEEVIQLCDETFDIAEKNSIINQSGDETCKMSHPRLWRWYLQSKSHYHMGRLDVALDLIEQREKIPTTSDAKLESAIALASSAREMLHLKRCGNEAFHSGKFTEAIEHYTAAISKSLDSRTFMAVCLCNRAAAYQATNQIIDAIADCSLAIALDEYYPKAISRRATLHEMIRDYRQASYDLQRLISLLQSRSPEKTKKHSSRSKSSGSSNSQELRKASNRFSSAEENAKMETHLDFYLILGIKASDSESEIKRAYRKAALRHHPDKASQVLVKNDTGDNGALWKEVGEKIHSDADNIFKIIGEAYAVLSDPVKRAKYDKEESIRNELKDNRRKSHSESPSTASNNFPFGRRNGSSSERNGNRRHWHNQWRHDGY